MGDRDHLTHAATAQPGAPTSPFEPWAQTILEERLALAVEAAELGTFYCPMPLGRIIWNDKCKEHFWLPPDAEVDFERFYSIIHPDDRQQTREAVERAVFDRQLYDVEYRTVAPDGRFRWVRAKGRAYYDANVNPTRFDGVTLDVSEQKRADESRRVMVERQAQQSRVFDKVLSSITDFAYTFDLQGRFTFANKPLLDLWRLPLDEAIGKNFFDLKYPDPLAAKLQQQIQDVIRTRQRVVDETPYTSASGAAGYYQYIFSPVLGADGAVEAVAGSTRDISDKKHMADERERLLDAERAARSDAERAGRLKDEFLATLSHELRTPLNAILGWSQILAESGGKDPEDIEEGLRTIERNARAQAQIIEDLLDMSRIISGKVRLAIQRIEMASTVQAAVDTVKPTADAKGIGLHSVMDSSGGLVAGDPARLQQVFWNLLTNAIKFTPRGGRVQVLLERVNSHLEVSVTDTGQGIKREFLPYVFDRFRQADAAITRKHGGLGLGLAIVKQLVELHGGLVRARSAGEGQGASFIVSLPISAVDPEPDSQMPERSAQARTAPLDDSKNCYTLKGVKVLVVDDEPDARALVKRLLEDCEAQVAMAGSVKEALEQMQAYRPDVLISDIGMPGEDGLSLIRRIRAMGPSRGGNLPAIALTAYARSEDRTRSVLAGFQMHIAKPVEASELVAMVASLAGRMKQKSDA